MIIIIMNNNDDNDTRYSDLRKYGSGVHSDFEVQNFEPSSLSPKDNNDDDYILPILL